MAIDPTIITDNDIRLFMIDKSADDNYLLDDVEFTEEEINQAHGLAVDKYNSTLPLTDIATEIPRYEAIIGTTAILLRMRAINMVRNRLDYQNKNGTAVQDKNKAKEYLELAREMSAEFDARIKGLKVHLNIESCYGGVGSDYIFDGKRF
jgi:hypothetical protein